MVKECLVILNNEAVTVVRYDSKDIQFPSIHKDTKKVFVNYENDRYSIVDESFAKKEAARPRKKKVIKKTTIEENVTNTEEVTENENE